MSFTIQVIVTTIQFGLGFYGFWLVWRVLLRDLPGPPNSDDRIAPYALYFTDPFVRPVAKALHAPTRLVALLGLIILAVLSVALSRVPGLVG